MTTKNTLSTNPINSLKKLKKYLQDIAEMLTIMPFIHDNTKTDPEDISIILDFNIEGRDVEVTLHSDGTWSFGDNSRTEIDK